MIRCERRRQLLGAGSPSPSQRGFSLLEVVVATLIVGVMMVAALESLGALARGRSYIAERSRGWTLAQDMMAEVLDRHYEEPDDTPSFGTEGSEASGNRSDYDDTDDYHGWVASPPQSKDGTVMSNLTDWERRVTVERVKSDNLNVVTSSDQGVRRITVEVRCDGATVVKLVTFRTKAWQEPPFE